MSDHTRADEGEGREPGQMTMQTSDQVAGEAREKLADKIAGVALDLNYSDALVGIITRCNLPMILAALRAQPERGAEEMRERAAACAEDPNQWLRYWNAKPFNATIATAIRALPLHPAKDEGGGR